MSDKIKAKEYEAFPGDTQYVRIFKTMRFSEAWKHLNSRQRDLYECMKLSTYRRTQSESKLIKNLPDWLDVVGSEKKLRKTNDKLFFFNRARWSKNAKELKTAYCFRLYSNQEQFYRDRDKLIECGFICRIKYKKPDELTDKEWTEAATDGGNRPKALYALSAEWRNWDAEKPP